MSGRLNVLSRSGGLLGLALVVAGCMVGPDYQRPELAVPSGYIEPAATDPSIANLPWWELFKDENNVSFSAKELINLTERAFSYYQQGQWDEALGLVQR